MDERPAVDPDRPPPPVTWATLGDVLRSRARDSARPLLVGLGVVVLAVAAWAVFLRAPAPPPIEASLPMAAPAGSGASSPEAVTTASEPAPEVVAHAAGAVTTPGVHRIPEGARVADLLAAAGGAAPDADLDRVNLAAPVADGDRVWFPRLGEEAPPPVATGSPGSAGSGGPGDGDGAPDAPLDLNTATAEQLDALPGIGPTIAAAIVAHRERDGPFRSVDELVEVRGIGDARLADLRDLVVVR